MKRVIILLLVTLLSVMLVSADDVDDQGNPNDPDVNERANACYEGGEMEGKCDTSWEWRCGWYLIRLVDPQNAASRAAFPRECISLLPPFVPVPLPGNGRGSGVIVCRDDLIINKVVDTTFRDAIVYRALNREYQFVAVLADAYAYTVDGTGRIRVEVIRSFDGSDYADVSSVVTRSCGTSAIVDGTVFTNQCGVLVSQTLGNPVAVVDVAPSAICGLLRSNDVLLVRPN